MTRRIPEEMGGAGLDIRGRIRHTLESGGWERNDTLAEGALGVYCIFCVFMFALLLLLLRYAYRYMYIVVVFLLVLHMHIFRFKLLSPSSFIVHRHLLSFPFIVSSWVINTILFIFPWKRCDLYFDVLYGIPTD